jgi:hypothetical protein
MDQLLAQQLNMDEDNPSFQSSSAIKNAIAEANADLVSKTSNKASIAQGGGRKNHGRGRGTFIDLPADYLQLPYDMYETMCLKRGDGNIMDREEYHRYGLFNSTPAPTSQRRQHGGGSGGSSSSAREKHDMELAMAIQQELLIQQLAEEERRQSSLSGVLGGLVSDAMDGLDNRWSQQVARTQTTQPQTSRNHQPPNRSAEQNRRVLPNNNNSIATQPMSSNVDDIDDDDSGFSLEKAKSFFANIGEDVKRKVNEVTVKFQVRAFNPVCNTQH